MAIKLAITSLMGGRKVRLPVSRMAGGTPGDEIEVAVNTSRPYYVPEKLHVRARVDETLFTASTTRDVLAELERDPDVLSVDAAQSLRPARPRR